MGYSQSALALGLVAGPITGSFLYDYGGYGFVMFSLAIMMVLATIFAAIMIESDKDLAADEDELLQKFLKEPLLTDKEEVIAVSDEEEEDELPLSYSDIIFIKVRDPFNYIAKYIESIFNPLMR